MYLNPRVVDQRVVQRQFGRARIAEDVAHAGFGEHLEHRLDAADRHRTTNPANPVNRVKKTKYLDRIDKIVQDFKGRFASRRVQ